MSTKSVAVQVLRLKTTSAMCKYPTLSVPVVERPRSFVWHSHNVSVS